MWMNITITALVFLAMEGVAWMTHKYVMHGLLWNLHEDHHKKNPTSFFEKNDYFFLIFAIPGIILLATGLYTDMYRLFFGGLVLPYTAWPISSYTTFLFINASRCCAIPTMCISVLYAGHTKCTISILVKNMASVSVCCLSH